MEIKYMTESDRITALETKVGTLEQRVNKLESSDENRVASLSGIDTKLQLLGQKFDSFVNSLEKTEETKKFNWTQMVGILAIIIGLGGTIWATSYTVKKTIESTETSIQLSEQDIKILTEVVSRNLEDNDY